MGALIAPLANIIGIASAFFVGRGSSTGGNGLSVFNIGLLIIIGLGGFALINKIGEAL